MKKPKYILINEDFSLDELFQKILQRKSHCFFFESKGEQSSENRYSIVGFDPQDFYKAKGSRLEKSGETIETANPYLYLQKEISGDLLTRDYAGGLVGFLAYEAIQYFEPSLSVKEHPNFSSFEFGLFLDGIIHDKITNETVYFYYGENRIDLVKKLIHAELKPEQETKVCFLKQSKTKEEHSELVRQAQDEILAGNTFQCQIGFERQYEISGSPYLIYMKLREINPSPHMFYLKFDNVIILGASPELLFRNRNSEMETYPLAGTTHRAVNREEDSKLASSLLADPKERAEHNMLIDLHRNDLGRVSRLGSVKVRRQFDIKRFSHVQHISSEVCGLQKYDQNSFESLASVFPAGTLSGAPKIESMKIIDRLENEPRGAYGGAIGHFGLNGDCAFSIPIRTLFIHNNQAIVRASGGIVYDSTPEKEYQEIENKMGSVLAALEPFLVSEL